MAFVTIALFWLLAIGALVSRGPALLYLFFASMPFGALAVVPPQLTGGLTFTPTPIVTILIILRAFVDRKGLDFFLTFAFRGTKLGLLTLFWLIAIFTTAFMPRLFRGEVPVVAIRGDVSTTTMLAPSAQNISQLVYISISILAVFAFAKILRSRSDRQAAFKALCFGGLVAALTGFLDFATQYAPIEPLLEPFRTATYALATNVEVLGSKRVVGLMPEASAFGGLCLGLMSALVFFRRAIADSRTRNFYAPIVIMMLALCCWLSTSSGTYLGVGVLILVMTADAGLRAFSKGGRNTVNRRDLTVELYLVLGLVATVGLLMMLKPTLLEPIYQLLDRMVFQKAESYSFEERGMWRRVAMESILATNGFGVGLGGTRSSSSFVAIFSSTGMIGGLLYYAFVMQTLMRNSSYLDWEGRSVITAFRMSFIPTFVLSMLVGGADFGLMTAFGFGIVTAVMFSKQSIIAKRRSLYRRRHRGRMDQRNGRPAPALVDGARMRPQT